MSISLLDKKLTYLRNSLTPKELAEMELCFQHCKLQTCHEYLCLDLMYCLLKHLSWLRVPIFQQVLLAFLLRNYRLEQNECLSLLQKTSDRLLTLKQLTLPQREEREFIKYVYVLTLSSDDEEKLLLELGFGSFFLQRLKEFLQQVAAGNKAQTHLFGFEAICYETLVELATELVQIPSHLARHRLQYQLLQETTPWSSLNPKKLTKVLDLLCRLHRQPLTARDMETPATVKSFSVKEIIPVLARAGVIYHGDFLARQKLYVWHLTTLGKEMARLHQQST